MTAMRLHDWRSPLVYFPFAFLVLTQGCTGARAPGSSLASAPALNGDRPGHNFADPNAPYTLRPTGARLQKREALLDLNGVPMCEPAQLSFFESGAQSSGPHHTIRFAMANAGEACRLGGFPSITLLQADGTVLGGIHIRKVSEQSMAATLGPATTGNVSTGAMQNEPSPEVLLTASGQAAFQLGWTAGTNCEQVARIAIAAPGSTATIMVPRALEVCEDQVLLTAVQ